MTDRGRKLLHDAMELPLPSEWQRRPALPPLSARPGPLALLVLALLVLLLASCGEPPACATPPHTTYSCQPLPAGSFGCIGGPKWVPTHSILDARPLQDDPDLIFPVGCHAFVPECSPFYQGMRRTFECTSAGTSQPAWGEAG